MRLLKPSSTNPNQVPASTALRRVAIVAPTGSHLWRLRGGLIGAMRAARHGVTTFASSYGEADRAGLEQLGVEVALLPPPAPGMQVFAERRWIGALAEQLAAYRPHTVVISGGGRALAVAKAARKAGIAQILALVNQVPSQSMADGNVKALLRVLELADVAVFHNSCDPKALKRRGVLPADLAYLVVPGAGVDLVAHAAQPLPPLNDGLIFLMIAQLDAIKGVVDYCKAARIVKARAPSVRCLLAGLPSEGAGSLSVSDIAAYADCVTYVGGLDDVRSTIGSCHVYVYPSLVEGMPRSVLEAMAAGRPIITTNGPGCRETVDERINGCLVPPSDAPALAACMETFLKRPDLIPSLARASRAKAERRFDERAVNATLMGVMGLG
jgi:glycosyltransferase involved in cell wall biosynthesis